MANKEDHMNMKNMSAKNMGNNESNMSHMDHDDMKMGSVAKFQNEQY
ncbi:hypothetical protein ACRFH7_002714 [Listeria monocytogenes]